MASVCLLNGDAVPIALQSQELVRNLRQRVGEALVVPTERIILIHNGTALADDETLHEPSLSSVIQVVLRAETEIAPSEIRILDKIGQGLVFLTHKALYKEREVAVQEFAKKSKRFGDIETPVMRVAVESTLDCILREVQHPNLVKALGVMSCSSPQRLVSELCQFGCCFQLLHIEDHIELNWAQKHKICLDVAEAMDYLHQCDPPIIHTNLKSNKCLLMRAVLGRLDVPFVKVSNFMLSRLLDLDKKRLEFRWPAPELIHKANSDCDAKVDVFSYSMILFEIICREQPFWDVPRPRIPDFIAAGERPVLHVQPGQYPDALRDLMCLCWEGEACKRPCFTSICEMLRALEFRYE